MRNKLDVGGAGHAQRQRLLLQLIQNEGQLSQCHSHVQSAWHWRRRSVQEFIRHFAADGKNPQFGAGRSDA
jgi:hypothetical protein